MAAGDERPALRPYLNVTKMMTFYQEVISVHGVFFARDGLHCQHYSFGSSNSRRPGPPKPADVAAAALPEGCEGELPGGLWGLVSRPGVETISNPSI